jgi:hypothetical protein
MYTLDWLAVLKYQRSGSYPLALAVLKNHRTGFGGFVRFFLSKENLRSLVLTLQFYLEVL